jgi:hypothetical protein
VLEYRRSPSGALDLIPLVGQSDPTGILELISLLDRAAPAVRNALKKAAVPVDKLVYQRGSIVHVNRQLEDVFGPTIDTIILGELDSVKELTTLDLNSAAAICTLKNLHINDISLDAKHQIVRVRAERFSVNQFTRPFDMIVCNPPYIPIAPASGTASLREYNRAVGGLELCIEVLNSLSNILRPDGVMLLMTSSLSHKEVIASVPDGFEVTEAIPSSGRRVPLDVDAVWRVPMWRAQLAAEARLEEDEMGGIWHNLRPIWIKRSTGVANGTPG